MDYIINEVIRKYTNGCIDRTFNWNLQSIIEDYSEKSSGYIIQRIAIKTELSEESKIKFDVSGQNFNTVYFECWCVEGGKLKMPNIKNPPQYDDRWLTPYNEIDPLFRKVSYETSMLNTYICRFGTKGFTKQSGKVAWVSIKDRELYEKVSNELKKDVVSSAGSLMASYNITFERALDFIFYSAVENDWDLVNEEKFHSKVKRFINDNRKHIQFDKIDNDGCSAYNLTEKIWNEG